MKLFFKRKTCRVCFSEQIVPFLDFGSIPLAGGFIKKESIGKEKKFPLTVAFCKNCSLVQVMEDIDQGTVFDTNIYLSSMSRTLADHFIDLAQNIKTRFYPKKNPFILEIGSNDGVLLAPLKELGCRVIGIEPSPAIARVAKKRGIPTITDFFNESLAEKLVRKYGECDAVFANNVFAHLPDLHSVLRGITRILKNDGIFVFEVHHVAHLVGSMEYDQIYHEHRCYYSLRSIQYLLAMHGMEVFDVEQISMHGGSLRVFAKKAGLEKKVQGEKLAVRPRAIADVLKLEEKQGIYSLPSLKIFSHKVHKNNLQLRTLILKLKKKGKTIVGYGAPGKAVVLLNMCGISRSMVNYVVDDSPLKQGHFIPGVHIPIFSRERFVANPPDYAILFIWNFAKEVMAKEGHFLEEGGKFIVPIPSPKIEG